MTVEAKVGVATRGGGPSEGKSVPHRETMLVLLDNE